MSKFHTTISRRDFMKALGLTGAGLGAAAATAPVIHDLDELAAAGESQHRYPWWVKERDYFDTTVPIDWDLKWRVDGRNAREYRNADGDWYFNAYDASNCKKYVDYAFDEDPDFEWGDPRRQALESGCSFAQFVSLTLTEGRTNHRQHNKIAFANVFPVFLTLLIASVVTFSLCSHHTSKTAFCQSASFTGSPSGIIQP